MDTKKLLEQAKELLKAAQENPEKFQDLTKGYSVKKDDKPHPPNSPEDKAHDISEDGEQIAEAAGKVKGDKSKMFEHLRTLTDTSQERSPKNKKAGEPKKKTEATALMLNEKEDVEKCGEMSKDEFKSNKTKFGGTGSHTGTGDIKPKPTGTGGFSAPTKPTKPPIIKSDELIEKATDILNSTLKKTLIGLGAMLSDPEEREKFFKEVEKDPKNKEEAFKKLKEKKLKEKPEEKEPEEASEKAESDPCWDSHKMIGMKDKGGKKVPNCVPKKGK
jgi:hypothetical protein